jgi:hypothetical protein
MAIMKTRYLKHVTVNVLNFLGQDREYALDRTVKRNEENTANLIPWLVMAEALELPRVARAVETTLAKYALNFSKHPQIHEVSRESLLRLLDMRKPS